MDRAAAPPRLSVLIPVYNEQYFVEQLVESVLAAPLAPGMERELIIVDDCSNDGTPDILQRLAARHPDSVRLFRHETNCGKGSALRTAIAEASGDICIVRVEEPGAEVIAPRIRPPHEPPPPIPWTPTP